ncbi:GIY-YIG nuclease family protein [Candidatus Daviesbacteria bacterium]|nr:GIY-YIG nuclease family protein [Candidatus Daviesbacteria bacterium]
MGLRESRLRAGFFVLEWVSMDLPSNLAFVDIETTGGSVTYDRVIEIGLLKICDNQIVKTYQTFLNPDRPLPDEIQLLTGITPSDLEKAPSFYDVKDALMEYFEDAVFVAHNARFDYGFLKQEFLRYGVKFTPKQLCTVKLSRLLFPEHRHHNLDSLIARFAFEIENRHRALSDAKILWDFYQRIQGLFPKEKIIQTVSFILKKPNIPPQMKNFDLSGLPESPGVYIFYGKSGQPLYVGKSKNIRERVFNHFSLSAGNSLEMKIYNQVESVEFIETAGELGALLKESEMIKKLMPLYNRMLRNKEQMVVAKKVQTDGVFSIKLEESNFIDQESLAEIMAVYKTRRAAKEALVNLTKEYNLCDKYLGLEKTKTSCFNYKLGKCSGICAGKEKPIKYNLRFIEAFVNSKIKSWPYKGPIIIKEVNEHSEKEEQFLIDNWCLVQKKDSEYQNLEGLEFDYDVYKILKRFLLRNPHQFTPIF